MKRVLIITNIILFWIVVVQSCGPDGAKSTVQNIGTLDTGFHELRFKDDTITGLLDANLAKEMSEDYYSDMSKEYVEYKGTYDGSGNVVVPMKSRRDASAIWFDIETLQAFINRAKHSVGSNCRKKLGIRIYYAKYPDDFANKPSLRGLNDDVKSKHTVFLVPTVWDDDYNMNIDFNMEAVGDSCKPVPFYKVMNVKPGVFVPGYSALTVARPNNTYKEMLLEDTAIQNHGGLSPPPDPGTFPTPSEGPAASKVGKKTNGSGAVH
jgi:hypothetical protein